MTAPRRILPATSEQFSFAYDGSIAVEIGDLLYHDSDDAKPASSQADAGTEDKNQRGFAQTFCGIAAETKLATAAAGTIQATRRGEYEFDCASATFEVGDLVAAVEAASGTALEDQKLKKTTDPSVAIGFVTKREPSAVTRVRVMLIAGLVDELAARRPALFRGTTKNAETLAGNKTLVVADAPIQALDPGGSGRDVTLPAEASSAGLTFIVRNTADAAEVLTIKDDGAATICTPTQNETALVWCDGSSWYGLVGSHV